MTGYLKKQYNLNSDELVEVIDEMPFWSAPFGLELLNNIDLKKNINVLDIGFGAGFPLTEVAMRLGKSCKIYGIDPWETAIKRVYKKLKIYGITNVKLINGVAENIPLTNNTINLIISNNGINNVADLDKTLSECARVIKPGGKFIQSINLNTSMIEFYNVFESTLKKENMDREITKMKEHINNKRKPLPDFLNKLEHYGFNVKDITHHEFKYSFIDGTTMFNHYFIQLAFLDSWKELIPSHKLENIFTKVETTLNKYASKKGNIELSIPFVVIDSRYQTQA